MAVKKSELYSGLWASCDSLRGGMDSSEYKNYILTLLFVKYVSDKYKGLDMGVIEIPAGGSFDDMLKLIGNKDIGEKMDKIIGRLAEANNLRGIIDTARFNDDAKLGRGKEKIDKLSELLAIFSDQMPDFSKNRADGDDIIGDAYEYLMRNFATESGKSKGQFYTPAEVSRILAKVVGIEHAKSGKTTLYDPACGSGSLLIRAAEAAPVDVTIYGQEKESTTAGLAKMNFVLHGRATATVKGGQSTFSAPQYEKDGELTLFDFAVVNPPFSDKNWTHGLQEFGRFDGYGDRPPQKNGDFAWMLHIIKSLKRNGKAAVILPHGILFRLNAEAVIRQSIVSEGLIKGIIGLPPNLFYGTSIAACIIVIDREINADERDGIFMIDASRDFIKDGNKNRLRERDVYKITTVFNQRLELPKYSRFVPISEIAENNAFNLSLSRYIDSSAAEDIQDIGGHLNGGIPENDIGSLSPYWQAFPKLESSLYKPCRDGYYSLAVAKDDIRDTIDGDPDFSAYADKVEKAFNNWKKAVNSKLSTIGSDTKPKALIADVAEQIVKEFEAVALMDKYDAYEVLLAYWNDVMADDGYMLVQDGYSAIREIEIFRKAAKKKDGTGTSKVKETGWDGKLVPKSLVIEMFFSAEQKLINDTEAVIASTEAELEEVIESADEDSMVDKVINDKGKLNKDKLKAKISKIRTGIATDEIEALLALLDAPLPKKNEVGAFIFANPLCKNAITESGTITKRSIKKRIEEARAIADVPELLAEDYAALLSIQEKQILLDERTVALKDMEAALDHKAKAQYGKLDDDQCLELLLERKWYRTLLKGIFELYTKVNHEIADRVSELAVRYENTLPELENEVAEQESKARAHLEKMGYRW